MGMKDEDEDQYDDEGKKRVVRGKDDDDGC